jgi:hypothetical protein
LLLLHEIVVNQPGAKPIRAQLDQPNRMSTDQCVAQLTSSRTLLFDESAVDNEEMQIIGLVE